MLTLRLNTCYAHINYSQYDLGHPLVHFCKTNLFPSRYKMIPKRVKCNLYILWLRKGETAFSFQLPWWFMSHIFQSCGCSWLCSKYESQLASNGRACVPGHVGYTSLCVRALRNVAVRELPSRTHSRKKRMCAS